MRKLESISGTGSWSKIMLFQIGCFLTVLFWIIPVLFYDQLVHWGYVAGGFVAVFTFFFFHHWLSIWWKGSSDRIFLTQLVILAIVIRVFSVFFLYYFYQDQTGAPFEYHAVDSKFYHLTSIDVSRHILQGDLRFNRYMGDIAFSDRGYNIFLGLVYSVFGPSIIAARLVNVLLSVATVYFIFKLARNLYSSKVARTASVSALLLPNFHLYLGTHLKETMMLFLVVLFLHLAVLFVKFQRRSALIICLLMGVGFYLFMFRTILGAVAILSFSGYAITSRPLKSGLVNMIAAGILIIVLGYFMWNSDIGNELAQYLEKSNAAVADNMQFRASRDGGNKFALLAGAPLFLSVILIAPFPSFVVVPEQDLLWMFIGANLIRNLYAIFTIAGLLFCFRKDFRNSSILLYFVLGYLLILANSGFAISERFHLPVVPVMLVLSSVAVHLKQKWVSRFFPVYLALLLILVIAWNYIKLAGRA